PGCAAHTARERRRRSEVQRLGKARRAQAEVERRRAGGSAGDPGRPERSGLRTPLAPDPTRFGSELLRARRKPLRAPQRQLGPPTEGVPATRAVRAADGPTRLQPVGVALVAYSVLRGLSGAVRVGFHFLGCDSDRRYASGGILSRSEWRSRVSTHAYIR